MKSLVCILVCAACASSGGDDYPVAGAGGTGGSGGLGTTPPAGTMIAGRVCVVDNLLDRACANSGAAGINVSLGSSSATTLADGSFQMAVPAGTNLSFLATGNGFVPSSQAFGPTNTMAMVRAELFNQMLNANGITTTPGSGSIMATVMRGGIPASGVLGMSTPSPAFGPFFDGTTPTAWTLDATGARGIVWFPGVTIGPTNLRFTDLPTGGEGIVGGVQVINGGITFVESVLP